MSFDEIDFGSYFQDYLDPGYRTQPEYEESEKPSFENFLSQPTTLSDHLAWQLGALTLDAEPARGRRVCDRQPGRGWLPGGERRRTGRGSCATIVRARTRTAGTATPAALEQAAERSTCVRRAIDLVQHLDPAGVGARDLRECLLLQIAAQQQSSAICTRSTREPSRTRTRTAASAPRPRRARGAAAQHGGCGADCGPSLASAAEARHEGPGARGAGHARGGACGRRVHPHARSAARPHLQPRADAAHRARCGFRQARRRVGGLA